MSGTTTTLYGETIQGKAAANWPALYKACEQFHKFKISIEDAEALLISDKQRGWLHCENGAIRTIMKTERLTMMDAKIFCKVRFGRDIFVKYVTPENYLKFTNCYIFWECQEACCRKIIHVAKIAFENNKRQCFECGSLNIRLIAVKSSEDLSRKQIRMWFEEMFDKIPGLQKPDERWFKNQNKETANVNS